MKADIWLAPNAPHRREALEAARAAVAELQEDEGAAAARVADLQAEVAAEGTAALVADLAAAQQATQHAQAHLAAAQQRQQQATGAAAAAETELAAIAAAQQQAAERQQAALAAAQQLRAVQPERQRLLQEAEGRLAAARQQQFQAAAAADEAQAALAAAESQLREVEQPAGGAAHQSAAAGRQTADQVVAVLAAAAASGKLPGGFHGRLHGVARLAPGQQGQHAQQAVGTAVNAALMEVCNLVRLWPTMSGLGWQGKEQGTGCLGGAAGGEGRSNAQSTCLPAAFGLRHGMRHSLWQKHAPPNLNNPALPCMLPSLPPLCRPARWWCRTGPPPRRRSPTLSSTGWGWSPARSFLSCSPRQAEQHRRRQGRGRQQAACSRWPRVWRPVQRCLAPQRWCSTCCTPGGWRPAGRQP